LIPADTAVKEAVTWAWERFKQSSDAAALDPEAQMIANLRQWIAERWDVTIKPVDAGTGINNREALAWYDDDSIYIPKDRIREAAGKALKRSEIGAVLGRRGLLAVKPAEDRFCVRWVPNIGRVAAYALSREEFGRSTATKDPDTFMVYGGGRQ
jgi:putative DNA primase/helicase